MIEDDGLPSAFTTAHELGEDLHRQPLNAGVLWLSNRALNDNYVLHSVCGAAWCLNVHNPVQHLPPNPPISNTAYLITDIYPFL